MSNVVQLFSSGVSRARKQRAPSPTAVMLDNPSPVRSLSATGENGRLRQQRYETWQKVDTQKDYWQARMEFNDTLWRAQRDRIPDALSYPAVEHADRWPLLENYRAAFAKLLLTPAPTIALVNWKKAVLANDRHRHTSVSTKRLEHAIADDLAFLAAHPVRQSNRGKRA